MSEQPSDSPKTPKLPSPVHPADWPDDPDDFKLDKVRKKLPAREYVFSQEIAKALDTTQGAILKVRARYNLGKRLHTAQGGPGTFLFLPRDIEALCKIFRRSGSSVRRKYLPPKPKKSNHLALDDHKGIMEWLEKEAQKGEPPRAC